VGESHIKAVGESHFKAVGESHFKAFHGGNPCQILTLRGEARVP